MKKKGTQKNTTSRKMQYVTLVRVLTSQGIEQCNPNPSYVYFDQPISGRHDDRKENSQETKAARSVLRLERIFGVALLRVMLRSIAKIISCVIEAKPIHVVIKAYKVHPKLPQSHFFAIPEVSPIGQKTNDIIKSPIAKLRTRTSLG